MQEICKSQETDERYFWYLVNTGKNQRDTVHQIKLVNGEIVSDPERIRDQWKSYFEELYTPKDLEGYDNEFMLKQLLLKWNVSHILMMMNYEYAHRL